MNSILVPIDFSDATPRVLDQAKQVSAMRQLFVHHMFAHTGGEEAFAGLIKQDSRTFLDQPANFA